MAFQSCEAFASGVLYIVLYAVRVTVNNIPSGEVFTPIFGGVGAVLIVQTFVNTGKEWFALDTKLVVNQDWLRRRRQQALQQRGRGAAWRGSVVRKNLYRAVDVEQYMELCILLSQELLEAFRLMLESGGAPADILLLLAARAGDVKTIEELLAAGADPLITDQQGREALQLARGIAARRMLAGAARATAKAES
ncbi:hypothetical protein D9Q98_000033 [Chlorella vulgaris]|uniref:Uncharacterized protein n=1 Tax=Chlorella vulgaris TaxID=3077 RepID=A0A9D4TXM7_CHLVU|nr:hypothetical protein D9Q98_000033 [Chlorella vulgaris]